MIVTSPLWLVLLAGLPWIVLVGRRAGVPAFALTARVVIVTCLTLAAAGLRMRASDGAVSVVFAIDRSDSVPIAVQARSLRLVASLAENMRAPDRSAVVVAGKDAVIDQRLAPRHPAPSVSSSIDGQGTDLEAALRVARAALPGEGARRIVLLSDGRETSGYSLREAAIAAAEGIRIDVLPLSSHEMGRSRITRVVAPQEVRVNEPYSVTTDVAGPAGASVTVTVERDGRVVKVAAATMDSSGTAQIAIDDQQRAPGAVLYSASLSDALSGDAQPPEAGAVVVAAGAARVLYAGAGGRNIGDALESGGFDVSAVTPADVPSTPSSLAAFSAVVLDDVAADLLNESQNSALAAFVEEQGGGLLLAGGAHSLGPAGYPGTPLGAALPVDLRKRSGTRAPDVALVIVVDKSGSMADAATGVSKMELARRAIVSVLQVVPPADPVGVIAFDTAAIPIAPLATGHAPSALMDTLRGIEPGGSTVIAPAIDLARQWLHASATAQRRILLLSDGRSALPDRERVLAMARAKDVEWSIVAIGTDVDRGWLEQLAAESGGRAYFPENVRMLPDIVAREAARATGGWRVQQRFTPRVADTHPVLGSIDTTAIPSLDGYVASVAKPTAAVILIAPPGDPIFSAWRFGLGRVAVFNGDVPPVSFRWTGFSPLWRQTVRWIGRAHDASRIQVETTVRRDGAALVVDVTTAAGDYMNALTGEAMIRGPGGRSDAVDLRQTAPGRYEARLRTPGNGEYVASISLRDPVSGEELRALRGWFAGGAMEHPGEAADLDRLAEIARVGGGSIIDETADAFAGSRPAAYRDISTFMTVIALFIFLMDAAARRGITPALLGELWRGRFRGPGGAREYTAP